MVIQSSKEQNPESKLPDILSNFFLPFRASDLDHGNVLQETLAPFVKKPEHSSPGVEKPNEDQAGAASAAAALLSVFGGQRTARPGAAAAAAAAAHTRCGL